MTSAARFMPKATPGEIFIAIVMPAQTALNVSVMANSI
eukprot:CAMPEP_0181286366 /NCGR_PEP_ID=MMETSP1097-20121128/16554_1 /TAXON_ID=35684 /ORGANISM="Pseudopedinella elastica, Strain CCMP716" /LENGTH=37 /DNA_ID= /DNA_START= /DNA_END= /DNA_ORIENTATION=